jgi:beta-RFAP synthase
MTRVETGSRLHFGLLAPPPAGGRRGFGGCGLMVESPAVLVTAQPAADWSATGPASERALGVARRVVPDRPCRFVVETCPPEHVGLGVGTQLSLSAAMAVLETAPAEQSVPRFDAVNLAQFAGRGARSAVGVHGFARGGFLVDDGKFEGNELARLVVRVEFPARWRLVLLTPPGGSVWHGDRERDAFAEMKSAAGDDVLRRLATDHMLPALARQDLDTFAGALAEYNARAGEAFRAAQGGVYGAAAGKLIVWLRGRGLVGVGQSSWGPTAFAVVGDADQAEAVVAAARREWGEAVMATATAARNRGAEVTRA